jgi:hypothetical protein
MKNKHNPGNNRKLEKIKKSKPTTRRQLKPLSPKVLNKLKTLKKLLKQQDTKCWKIGDMIPALESAISILQLVFFHQFTAEDIPFRTVLQPDRSTIDYQD